MHPSISLANNIIMEVKEMLTTRIITFYLIPREEEVVVAVRLELDSNMRQRLEIILRPIFKHSTQGPSLPLKRGTRAVLHLLPNLTQVQGQHLNSSTTSQIPLKGEERDSTNRQLLWDRISLRET